MPPMPSLALPEIPCPATTHASDAAVRTGWTPLQREVLLPVLLLALATIALQVLGGDRWIADRLYAAEGGRWALRDAFWTTRMLHAGGKAASMAAWGATASIVLLSSWRARWRPLRRPAGVLLLSVTLSTLLVVALKHLTRMDCPWDAAAYGGTHPMFTLFQPRPAGIRPSGCFPAGQASAGYAWIALYFFFRSVRPAWRHAGLAIGVLGGLVLGIVQQLRGAHYLSHDAWTLAICWLVAEACHRLANRLALRRAALAAHRNVQASIARDRRD